MCWCRQKTSVFKVKFWKVTFSFNTKNTKQVNKWISFWISKCTKNEKISPNFTEVWVHALVSLLRLFPKSNFAPSVASCLKLDQPRAFRGALFYEDFPSLILQPTNTLPEDVQGFRSPLDTTCTEMSTPLCWSLAFHQWWFWRYPDPKTLSACIAVVSPYISANAGYPRPWRFLRLPWDWWGCSLQNLFHIMT